MARGLFRNGRNNRWRVRLRYPDGSTRCVSTGQREHGAALVAAKRLQREAADPAPAAYPLGEALDAFLASLDVNGGHSRRGCRPATIRFYQQKTAALRAELGEATPIGELRVPRLEDYIRTRRGDGVQDPTIAKELGALGAVLRRARRVGRWRGELDPVLPPFRVPYVPRVRHLTPAEFERLALVLRPHRALIVRVIVLSGARNSEWERLERGHVELDAGLLELPGTKTAGARRVVPIAPELREVLLEVIAVATGDRLLRRWPNIRRDLAAACRRAGIARVTPNDLRRTFATWLWKGGMSPAEIGRLLGHRDSRMVERVYGQLRAEDLAAKVIAALEAVRGCKQQSIPVLDGKPAIAGGVDAEEVAHA
jgi:integrase